LGQCERDVNILCANPVSDLSAWYTDESGKFISIERSHFADPYTWKPDLHPHAAAVSYVATYPWTIPKAALTKNFAKVLTIAEEILFFATPSTNRSQDKDPLNYLVKHANENHLLLFFNSKNL